MTAALAITRDENKQLRNALGRTALQLLGAAYLSMEERQDWPADTRGLQNHDAPMWSRWAAIAFDSYRSACGWDAADTFGYARELRPWAGRLTP